MAGFFETYVDPLNKVIEEKDAEIKKKDNEMKRVIKERDTEIKEKNEMIEKMKAEIARLGGNTAAF